MFGLDVHVDELGRVDVGDVAQGVNTVGARDVQEVARQDMALLVEELRGHVGRVGRLAIGRDVEVSHHFGVVAVGPGSVEGELCATVFELRGSQDPGAQTDVNAEGADLLQSGLGHFLWTSWQDAGKAADL